jgi:hypothetical protein
VCGTLPCVCDCARIPFPPRSSSLDADFCVFLLCLRVCRRVFGSLLVATTLATLAIHLVWNYPVIIAQRLVGSTRIGVPFQRSSHEQGPHDKCAGCPNASLPLSLIWNGRRALCACGPKSSGKLVTHLWNAVLLFTDPTTLYIIGGSLFALLGVTYTRLFFVFNILDVALYFTILRVSHRVDATFLLFGLPLPDLLLCPVCHCVACHRTYWVRCTGGGATWRSQPCCWGCWCTCTRCWPSCSSGSWPSWTWIVDT